MNKKERENLESHPGYSQQHKLVDSLLQQKQVAREILLANYVMNQARIKRKKFELPERTFRFVSGFGKAIYSLKEMTLYEAEYHIDHNLIRILHEINSPNISATYFLLKGAPNVKILFFDSYERMTSLDLQILREKGYLALFSSYKWLLQDTNFPEKVVCIPSNFTGKDIAEWVDKKSKTLFPPE